MTVPQSSGDGRVVSDTLVNRRMLFSKTYCFGKLSFVTRCFALGALTQQTLDRKVFS